MSECVSEVVCVCLCFCVCVCVFVFLCVRVCVCRGEVDRMKQFILQQKLT